MPRLSLVLISTLAMLSATATAEARPKRKPRGAQKEKKPREAPATPEQLEADRHFKAGVTLYQEGKYAEALAEFERAYEIAPHPLVLYNIAGCHRELSNYAESVRFSRRFLEEGKGVVSESRLATAETELEGVLARIARVTVTVPVEGAELVLDGTSLGTLPLEMPIILPPGEHRLVARAEGYREASRSLRVASGDELDVELELTELPDEPEPDDAEPTSRPRARAAVKRFSLGAAFGTNLRQLGDTGAPSARLAVALGSRVELGVEGVFVAYAVVPSLRVRLFGDGLAVHMIGAAPVAFNVGEMKETFVAGAGGLGLRLRVSQAMSLRLESYASYAGKTHGTTFPAFFGGELWF
ncbi:MAG: tetratricopeptide repeat protein [Kofleriaceae bacterium]